MAGWPPGFCYKKIKNPPFDLNFGFYSVSATLKWVRHGEKEDRTGLIQVGAVLVNASWNLCQGHGKGQWPNLFFCSQSISYAPGRGEKKAQLWGSAVALWIKSSVSSSKPLCRKPLLFYSYQCDELSNLTAATAIDPSEAIGCTERLVFCKEVGHYKMPVQQLTFSVYYSYLDMTWSLQKGTLRQGNAVKTSLNSRRICLFLARWSEEKPLGSL